MTKKENIRERVPKKLFETVDHNWLKCYLKGKVMKKHETAKDLTNKTLERVSSYQRMKG